MAFTIKKMTKAELAQMALGLNDVIYKIECFSTRDLALLTAALQELVERGVDISDEAAVRRIARSTK